MQLDNRTLIVSSILVTTVLSLLDILIWRTRNTFPGFGRWTIAHALFAPTMLLFSLRSILTDWLTMVAANTMATIIVILVLEAARQFRGLRPRTWQAYAWAACGFSAIMYFRYVANNLNVRVLVAAIFLGGMTLFAAKVLLTAVPKDQGAGMKYTGWLLAVCGFLQIARGVYSFFHAPMKDLFEPSTMNSVSFVGMALGVTGISFGFLAMTGERLVGELNRLQRGLETDVKKRTAELHEAQRALAKAQKLESLGRLAGSIAHDFNHFLTVIRGYIQLLTQETDTSNTFQDDVAQITAACDQALLLTQQLLAFSRRQTLELKVVDLNAVIRKMATMLTPLLGENIEVVIVPSALAAHVKADSGQMHRVILNLFLNARDAMVKGGTLTIETEDVELTAADSRRLPDALPGRYVMLSIGDTGPGMSQEMQSRIFEPFFTTKPTGQGTGLGLATVYGIVKQTGGHIEVESEPAKGTRFRILLPFTTEEIGAQAVESSSRGLPCSPLLAHGRILIVDDAMAIRKVLRRILEKAGYEVVDAADVETALDLLRAGPVDVVLTDIQMPGCSGVELARLVKRDFPATKVIAMSGFDNVYLNQVTLELGIEPTLMKPMHPAGLIDAVRVALERAGRKSTTPL